MRKKHLISILLAIVLLAAAVFWLKRPLSGGKLPVLSCTVLKVGRADAIVIESGSHVMVIDAGEEEDGQEVVDFLKDKGILQVDVLLITHFDKDHVGGADTLIEQIPVIRVLIPDYEGVIAEYRDFMAALGRRGIAAERVGETLDFPLGDALVHVMPPGDSVRPEGLIDYDNDLSLVTSVTHGVNRLLFTGDIEKSRIREMIGRGELEKCDFLKVPHHGVYNTALNELLEIVKPRYAAITSSAKNPADSLTLEVLKACGAEVLETRFGKITLISNGSRIEMNQKVKH